MSTDAEFVRDCWRYLQACEQRWRSYDGANLTPLETDLVLAMAYARLARARAAKSDDPSAEIVFHIPLRDVSDEAWSRFARRTSRRALLI